MRIIAGIAKGRRLKSVRGTAVRPTADRVKEALFSMLGSRFALLEAEVLDLFSGSGGLGLEALSRGARRVVFVEQHAPTLAVLRDNVAACGFGARAVLRRAAADRALEDLAAAGERFDGVLADPPYGRGLVAPLVEQVATLGIVRPGGWLTVEHHVDEAPGDAFGALRLTRSGRYGKTALSLFEVEEIQKAVPT
jgi:16S rRNA (guanine(966)-N(2))-methyltransferase RsmD